MPAEGEEAMKHRVITCGRCGRENRCELYPTGHSVWQEPGWVWSVPAAISPLGLRSRWADGQIVCPNCQTEEECPTAERWTTIVCGRCRRELRGSLDKDTGCVIEWEEDGWADLCAATVSPMEEPTQGGREFVLSPWMHICPGCQTGDERDYVEAVRESLSP
jgi:hypothetical protein